MGAIVTILPLVLEGLKLVPTLVKGGVEVYKGIEQVWEGVTKGESPTPEQQKQYDDAMEKAFNELMQSTDDVKE